MGRCGTRLIPGLLELIIQTVGETNTQINQRAINLQIVESVMKEIDVILC